MENKMDEQDKEQSASGQECNKGCKRKRTPVETETEDTNSMHHFTFLGFLPKYLYFWGVVFKLNNIFSPIKSFYFISFTCMILRGSSTSWEMCLFFSFLQII